MKNIKVLQVNKFYHPHIGGMEKVAQDIAEGLSDRVDMTVLTCRPKGGGCVEKINGITVVRAGSIGTYLSMPVSGSFPFWLYRLSRQMDILHFHLPFPLGDLSRLSMNFPGKTLAWWHCDIVRQKNWLKFYRPFLINFLHKADRIMVATPQHLESSEILSRFRDKCVVIPFGIDGKNFYLTESLKNRVLNIRKIFGPRIILFVGRLVYYKGVDYLIRAMAEVEGKLLLIGEGPLQEYLEKLAREVKVEDRVSFLGRVREEQMPEYFQACDLLVLPSVANTEAFGLVQLEAMICGKPVINTALPTGVPRISLDGETGITVPPQNALALAQAINRLLDDERLRMRYGHNARLRVEKEFSRDVMLERIYQVYREVLGIKLPQPSPVLVPVR